ncbi:MAG: beta-ketoacyl-[acyl-carrier-protein] synthase family protein [Chloroflexota bacterium]|nr:beta-ketoacyl-[acyl-carrier-protein] synthase family protein [Chloroflexota bacterium]
MERVCVTGMGVASALGCTLDDYWTGLTEGHPGVVFLEDEQFSDLTSKIGARVTGFEEGDFFSKKDLRRISRTSRLAVVAADQAIKGSGLMESDIDPAEVGVMIGSSIGGFSASDPMFKKYYTKGRLSPFTIPLSMNVAPSSNVSIRYRFQGPLLAVDAACASGSHSIAHALMLIRSGVLQVAVTGGADSPLSPAVVAAWDATRALCRQEENPASACRPFSADRTGMVLGEGAGVLVLESESSARRRGAQIWAEIKGFGASSDSYHLTQPVQEGPLQSMRRALENASISPSQIDFVAAHGTGTVWNDSNETAAIKAVFGDHAYRIPVVSSKGALGHTIAASGVLGFISSVLSLRDQLVPPTINCRVPDPECDLNYVTEGCISHKLENVLVNAFAFGGSNATLVVGKYT